MVIEDTRCPSWQQFYSGSHWNERVDLKNDIKLRVRHAIDPNRSPFTVPVFILYIAQYKNHPVDSDNMLTKMFTDGLKGWLIVDDDLNYVVGTAAIPVMGDSNNVTIYIFPAQ